MSVPLWTWLLYLDHYDSRSFDPDWHFLRHYVRGQGIGTQTGAGADELSRLRSPIRVTSERTPAEFYDAFDLEQALLGHRGPRPSPRTRPVSLLASEFVSRMIGGCLDMSTVPQISYIARSRFYQAKKSHWPKRRKGQPRSQQYANQGGYRKGC